MEENSRYLPLRIYVNFITPQVIRKFEIFSRHFIILGTGISKMQLFFEISFFSNFSEKSKF